MIIMNTIQKEVKTRLRLKCSTCDHWNRVPVNKIFIEQPTSKPKVKVLIPYYEPLKTDRAIKYKNGELIFEE